MPKLQQAQCSLLNLTLLTAVNPSVLSSKLKVSTMWRCKLSCFCQGLQGRGLGNSVWQSLGSKSLQKHAVMAVAPCCSSYKSQSLIRASAQAGYWGSDPCWTDLVYCLSAKSFAFLGLSVYVSLCWFFSLCSLQRNSILNQKRLICWAIEVYKWARWNIWSFPSATA